MATNLRQWLDEQPHGTAARIARQIGVTKSWFSQIVQGHQQPGPELTGEIWRATNGAVTRESLRPDLFGSQP